MEHRSVLTSHVVHAAACTLVWVLFAAPLHAQDPWPGGTIDAGPLRHVAPSGQDAGRGQGSSAPNPNPDTAPDQDTPSTESDSEGSAAAPPPRLGCQLTVPRRGGPSDRLTAMLLLTAALGLRCVGRGRRRSAPAATGHRPALPPVAQAT